MNFNKDKKFLAISCLQKCIRRGEADLACEYAKRLYEIEKSYLSYRLAVILIEDIGFGNLPLISEYLSTEIKSKNIEEKGGLDWILDVVKKAALSTKDKTPLEIIHHNNYLPKEYFAPYEFLLDYQNVPAKEIPFASFNQSQEEFLFHSYFDEKDVYKKGLLSSFMIGNQSRSFNSRIKKIAFSQKRFDLFFEKIAMQYNQKVIIKDKTYDLSHVENIVYFSQKLLAEDMFLGFPIVYEHLASIDKEQKIGKFSIGDTVSQKFKNNHCYHDHLQDNWFSPGIDKHCLEGKKVVQKISQLIPIQNFSKCHELNDDMTEKLMGHMLFRLDGGLLNHQLIYPMAISAYQTAHMNYIDTLNSRFSSDDRRMIQWNDMKVLFNEIFDSLEKYKKESIKAPNYYSFKK